MGRISDFAQTAISIRFIYLCIYTHTHTQNKPNTLFKLIYRISQPACSPFPVISIELVCDNCGYYPIQFIIAPLHLYLLDGNGSSFDLTFFNLHSFCIHLIFTHFVFIPYFIMIYQYSRFLCFLMWFFCDLCHSPSECTLLVLYVLVQ